MEWAGIPLYGTPWNNRDKVPGSTKSSSTQATRPVAVYPSSIDDESLRHFQQPIGIENNTIKREAQAALL